MLDEDTKEALQAAKKCAVNHIGAVWLAVFTDVFHAKALRQVEIELNCRELPLAPQGVLNL